MFQQLWKLQKEEIYYRQSLQARSQDLKKGGFFERVRKLQTTFTQIFIVLESESLGLSKN